jgi:hypothetical protein
MRNSNQPLDATLCKCGDPKSSHINGECYGLIGISAGKARQCTCLEFTPDSPAMPETVNHPDHYTSHPSGVECITVVEHMGFNLGNAIKYVWRADSKGNALEDLAKAKWYIEREIKRRTKQ